MNTTLSEPPPIPASAPQPDRVERQLAAADRILQKERGATGFLRLWPWLCGGVIGALALDVTFHLEAGPRLAITLGALVALFSAAAWYGWTAWRKTNPVEHTARILESRDPRLGSKLMNALQLREQSRDPELSPLTRSMARQAVEKCGEELNRENLPALARTDQVRAESKSAGFGLLGLVLVLVLAFDVTRIEVPRFLDPFGDHPPYSFTRLEISEPGNDETAVVYGQNLLVTATASGHRPGELFLSFYPADRPGEITTVPMFNKGEQGFSQQIERVQSELVLVAHTRTKHAISKQRRVRIILTPKLERSFVKITPPAYTGIVAEERPLQFKSLKALAGSRLEFRLQSNRPLGGGRMEVSTSPGAPISVALTSSAENEVSGTMEATESAKLRFSIVDRDGHISDEVWELSLNVSQDLGPTVQITNPSGDSFVAEDFKIDGIVEASDDYGLKTVRIHRGRNDVWEEPRSIEYDRVTRNTREGFDLNFKELGAKPGEVFTIFAEAIDTDPEPHISRTPVVTLRVISTEEYNSHLRQQIDIADIENKYTDLLHKLHDLAEEQRKLGEQIEALKAQMAQAENPEALAPKLDELLARQNEVNTKLNKLADAMDDFVRDQPLYDVESELQKTLSEKAQQIRDSTAKNIEDTQAVSQQSSNANGGRQLNEQMLADLKTASDQQLERLGLTEKQAREEVLQPLEDMSLMHELVKDLNRFRELYEAQRTLEQQVKAYDRPGPLTREDQLALKDLAAMQKQIGDQLEAVEQRLREDAKAAEEKFPKASKSAGEIADRIGELRLPMLASQATDAMLAGRGDQGAQLASRLREEMEKLFSECNSKGGEMSNELDQRLSLSRGLNPGNSFEQMMQCRKFGANPGTGFGMGASGAGGMSGYAVQTGPNANVLGNETAISSTSSQPGAKGLNQAKAESQSAGVALDKPHTASGVNAVNRESGAVQGEAGIEQYSELVEKYFKAITK